MNPNRLSRLAHHTGRCRAPICWFLDGDFSFDLLDLTGLHTKTQHTLIISASFLRLLSSHWTCLVFLCLSIAKCPTSLPLELIKRNIVVDIVCVVIILGRHWISTRNNNNNNSNSHFVFSVLNRSHQHSFLKIRDSIPFPPFLLLSN